MERNIEYIQLFMEYESDDMPMVYFYEVDVNDDRFALRAIEIFVDRTVKFYNDLYCDVVEACPVPFTFGFFLAIGVFHIRKCKLIHRYTTFQLISVLYQKL